jgi:serine/threonine protein kinase
MNNDYFDSVDERCRTRFESDWLNERATDLRDYLPDANDALYLGTLHELVHIDMEFKWKRFANLDGNDRPEPIAEYVKRFPQLNQPNLLADLIQAEFELRWQYQDEPNISDYILEFGKGPDGSLDVAGALESLARRLATQTRSGRETISEGTRLGRYMLVVEHARGGFGAVWRADDTKMGRRIALKRLGSNPARQSETRRRFVSEARVTARLEHPGIVPVYDMSSLDEEHAYYTMKLVRGDTMAEKIKATHELPEHDSRRAVEEKNLLQSFLDVCNTIEYCHARGVIHRDLKPQNVVIGNFGETILLDWGLASVSASETNLIPEPWDDQHILSPEESVETLQGSVSGTPGYMPPEQAGSEFDQIGTHSDIYSLGAMLYHIISGQTAFGGGRAMSVVLEEIREGRFLKPRSIDSSIPRALEAICLKAMQRLPEDRYESVKDLSTDIERHLADEPIAVCREPVTVRFRRWIKKHQTLATGLALASLFAIVASIAGVIVYNNTQKREANRVAEIRDAALQAESAGMLQLSENQWESAMQFLEQAVTLVHDEPDLSEIRERVTPKAERLKAIVDAYRYADLAQYYLFEDHLSKAAIYAQAAVQRLGILEHPDWWNHVAIDGMNPKQIHYLQDEIYRLFGMWAAMRFAETTPTSFSLDWFVGLASSEPSDKQIEASCKSAKFAAAAAQRYRPSNLMRLITYGSNLLLKQKDDFKFPVQGAENPSDAAMLGSILDNNISDNKLVMRFLLADKNPETAAETLLLDGLANIPDWYWLAIFVGENQIGDREFRAAIRTLSHAVGVKPDGWMGYTRRANAYVFAAIEAPSEAQKNSFLKNALLDIKRAQALAPHDPRFLFDLAMVTSFVDGGTGSVSDIYLHSIFNTPFVKDTVSQHRVAIVKELTLGAVVDFESRVSEQENIEATRMAVAAFLWMGDLENARKKIKLALDYQEGDPTTRMLGAFADLFEHPRGTTARDALESAITDGADYWVGYHQLGLAWEVANEMDKAQHAYERALERAEIDWQIATTNIALCRVFAATSEVEKAIKHFESAMDADISVDVASMERLLKAHNHESLRKLVRDHVALRRPYFDPSIAVIASPALTNGGFELELSNGWGESKRNSPQVWEYINGFWTTGIRDVENAIDGEACFRVVSLRKFVNEDSMSMMTQRFPVTAGTRYRVTAWCRAEETENKTLGIYSDEKALNQIVAFPGGTYDWQEFIGEFTATDDFATLVIACKGNGTAWIDNLTIESAKPAN